MISVETTLRRIGGHVANVSYQRFIYVMELILREEEFPSGKLMTHIYTQASLDLDVSRDVLVRSVARVVDDIWINGNKKVVLEILKEKPDYKPYPKDMLYYLYKYIKEKQREESLEREPLHI